VFTEGWPLCATAAEIEMAESAATPRSCRRFIFMTKVSFVKNDWPGAVDGLAGRDDRAPPGGGDPKDGNA
jgi:hypothetical protein